MAKKRDYKREYQLQKKRDEHPNRMERQKLRRKVDKEDTGTMTKTSPRRKGKDLAHNKALSKGGSNKDGYTVQSKSKNRSNNYKKKGPKKAK